jgi:hypothetical protein
VPESTEVNGQAFVYEDVDLTIKPEEVETFRQADSVPPIGDFEYACEVCGVELKYGGRGRKPKFCADHKSGNKSNGPTVSRTARWQQPLAEALHAQFMTIAMVVMVFDQYDGQVIMQGSPQLAQSLIAVAEANPSVRRGLETFVTAGAWAQVASATAAIALPIMAHHGIIPSIKMPKMAG